MEWGMNRLSVVDGWLYGRLGRLGYIFLVNGANLRRPKYFFQNIILLISRFYSTAKSNEI